jgi:PHD and RING finger domain-containing protein 1
MVDSNSVAIPSTSSKSAAHTSVGRNDEQPADCLACSICYAKFTTQEIGTTDTCNHSFCAACIKEWSMYVSTCPLDRQTFHFILVRHRLKGEIIKRIPVRSVRKELSFCGVCGECDRENRLLLCEGCSFACHVTCVDPPLDTPDYRQWICPYCFSLNEIIG